MIRKYIITRLVLLLLIVCGDALALTQVLVAVIPIRGTELAAIVSVVVAITIVPLTIYLYGRIV